MTKLDKVADAIERLSRRMDAYSVRRDGELQDTIRATLEKSGIPAKEIKVYGSQIMITTVSQDAAEKWGSLISKFARVRKIWKAIDENKGQDPGTMNKKYHDVWRVAAVI